MKCTACGLHNGQHHYGCPGGDKKINATYQTTCSACGLKNGLHHSGCPGNKKSS